MHKTNLIRGIAPLFFLLNGCSKNSYSVKSRTTKDQKLDQTFSSRQCAGQQQLDDIQARISEAIAEEHNGSKQDKRAKIEPIVGTIVYDRQHAPVFNFDLASHSLGFRNLPAKLFIFFLLNGCNKSSYSVKSNITEDRKLDQTFSSRQCASQQQLDDIQARISEAIVEEHNGSKQEKCAKIEPIVGTIVHDRQHAPTSDFFSTFHNLVFAKLRGKLIQCSTFTLRKYVEDSMRQYVQSVHTSLQSDTEAWDSIAQAFVQDVVPHIITFASDYVDNMAGNMLDAAKYRLGLEPNNIKDKTQYEIENDENEEGFTPIMKRN